MSKLVITFVCENRHEVEVVTVDLKRTGELSSDEIWEMQSKDCRCRKCGSENFIYRTRYKE